MAKFMKAPGVEESSAHGASGWHCKTRETVTQSTFIDAPTVDARSSGSVESSADILPTLSAFADSDMVLVAMAAIVCAGIVFGGGTSGSGTGFDCGGDGGGGD